MERYVCIHGHFYQPPRENPWLEAIELQDAAYPYHDWNERIKAECYAPNSASRILDSEGRIVHIANNYARISFNVGPTLLAWLEEKAPGVYKAILVADQESQRAFSGHGSALAQPYNHMILPLANRQDKYTQVLWGIRDFEHRFGRQPEGMWLPETAVDLETLDIMAELGIQFTILAPRQASRVRRIGSRNWHDLSGGQVDPTRAYMVHLPSRRTINVFFYDDPISRAVAFEGLLARGEGFAERLLGAFSEGRDWPQIVHIATDGETYGHHHRHGDMALAYALHHIQSNGLARLTNYGEFLERYPSTHQVEIIERTSWSCSHGLERWRSDCGCNSGRHPGWNQAWRAPLREALDWLGDALAPAYEDRAGRLLRDPWAARNDYISVVLDRSPENVDRFLSRHAVGELTEADKITALKLLELQRHTMLMYTSCGWFFDDLSGIEAVQVIQYAGRAVQLAQELFGDALEERFLALLERAKSNVPSQMDGRRLYEKFVKPAMVNWQRLGAHYAVSSVFEPYPKQAKVYCYTFDRGDYRSFEVGVAKLVAGRARAISEITRESAELSFAVLYFGDHNVSGGVRLFREEEAYQSLVQEIAEPFAGADFPEVLHLLELFRGEEAYQSLVQELAEPFARADFPEVLRLLDKHFGEFTCSLRSLFRDEQRKILNQILSSTLAEAETLYRQIYEHHAPLMRFLTDLGISLPKALRAAVEAMMNAEVRRSVHEETLDLGRVRSLFKETATWGLELDVQGLTYAVEQTIERLAKRFHTQPGDLLLLQTLEAVVDVAHLIPFEIDLWQPQNIYYDLLHTAYPEFRGKADQGDEEAQAWVSHFVALGEKLSMRVE